jgi:hypothetical protein
MSHSQQSPSAEPLDVLVDDADGGTATAFTDQDGAAPASSARRATHPAAVEDSPMRRIGCVLRDWEQGRLSEVEAWARIDAIVAQATPSRARPAGRSHRG